MRGSGKPALKLEDAILRIGLISTGAILFRAGLNLWTQAISNPLTLVPSIVAWTAGTALTVLALTADLDSRWVWCILGGLIYAQLSYAYVSWLNQYPLTTNHTDNEMIAQFAVQALKRGQNPYGWDFSDMLRVFRDRGKNFTPFRDGAFQNRVTYPALPTLILFGCDLLGIGQARTVALISQLVLLSIVFFGAPAAFRPVVLLPLFMLDEFVHLCLHGVQDVVWSVLLVGVIWTWNRPTWRAVLFGLACAYRQQPWFVAPFLLILMWRGPGTMENRRWRIAHFAAISLGVFAIVNVPFVAWDPRAWLLGVFEPVYASFNVHSQGLGALWQYGVASLSGQYHTALQASSYLIMLIIHWRHPRFVGQAFWMFPAIFFWFYYRSLVNYWIYWIPPLLFALTLSLSGRPLADVWALPQGKAWRRTAILGVALLVPNLLWSFFILRRSSPIELDYRLPLEVSSYDRERVERIHLTVENNSNVAVEPRFAVQRDPGIQSLPWRIEHGPNTVSPGQSSTYTIHANTEIRTFFAGQGAQIVFNDARGDDALRRVKPVLADESFTKPDLVVNPAFAFWPHDGHGPVGWTLRTWRGTGSADMVTVEGRDALEIELRADTRSDGLAMARLSQRIAFVPEFSIWVYPTSPAASTEPLQNAYGLELDDGQRTLWVLFGDSGHRGKFNEDFAYIVESVPLERWSKETIELAAMYEALDWPLPPFSPRHSNGLEYPARQVELSLLVGSQSRAASIGVFGPIEQRADTDPDRFVREVLDHPALYYVSLGDEYRRQRNYIMAAGAYERALVDNPTSAEALFGLAEATFWCDDWRTAIELFERSLGSGYRSPGLAHRGIGWSYYNLRDYDEAAEAFARAARHEPKLADAYNGLGWVLLQKGHYERALLRFEKALALAPDFPEPQLGIEECRRLQRVGLSE
jgi:hypothetical protein